MRGTQNLIHVGLEQKLPGQVRVIGAVEECFIARGGDNGRCIRPFLRKILGHITAGVALLQPMLHGRAEHFTRTCIQVRPLKSIGACQNNLGPGGATHNAADGLLMVVSCHGVECT